MVLKIRTALKGSHVHSQLFVGPVDGNLAHVGEVVMRVEEHERFLSTLKGGMPDHNSYDDEGKFEHLVIEDDKGGRMEISRG